MNEIVIRFDKDISLFSVEIGEKIYECLAKDEVLEVVKEEMDNADRTAERSL